MSLIRLADAHAHLDLPEYALDQSEVIEQARKAGVALMINVGISLQNSREVIATAQKNSGIFATVGVHPHGAAGVSEVVVAAIAELLQKPKVVALGEIGLDFYRHRAPAEVQERVFRRFLDLAVSHQKARGYPHPGRNRQNFIYPEGISTKAPWRRNALF